MTFRCHLSFQSFSKVVVLATNYIMYRKLKMTLVSMQRKPLLLPTAWVPIDFYSQFDCLSCIVSCLECCVNVMLTLLHVTYIDTTERLLCLNLKVHCNNSNFSKWCRCVLHPAGHSVDRAALRCDPGGGWTMTNRRAGWCDIKPPSRLSLWHISTQ